jgi:hypothetical protein
MATYKNSKVDYAPHQLEAKAILREIHEKLLNNKYGEAATLVDNAVVELRLMKAAINSHVHP